MSTATEQDEAPADYQCSIEGCTTVQRWQRRGRQWVLPGTDGHLDCPGQCWLGEVVREAKG